MNRTFLIIGSIVLVILIGVGLYLRLAPSAQGTAGQGSGHDFFSAFFPFGNGGSKNNGGNPSQDQNAGAGAPQKVTERLRKITSVPTVGGWFVATATTTASTTPFSVWYVERSSGNVYETPIDTYAEMRLSNTTVTGMQELIPVNASSFIFRTLIGDDSISNSLATVATSSDSTLTDASLPPFNRISVSSNGSTMLTVTETASGSRVSVSKPDGTGGKTFFTSPIRSWVPLASNGSLFLETAPASGIPGYLYAIQNDGSLQKMVGDIPGLMALPSPSGRYVLYSAASGDSLSLGLIDVKTGASYQSPIATLATKCAWEYEDPPTVFCGVSRSVPNASLPDDWLLGNVSLDDSAWLIQPVTGTAHALGRLGDSAGEAIDVMDPAVSSDGHYALFTNKNDLTLWSLDLTRDQ